MHMHTYMYMLNYNKNMKQEIKQILSYGSKISKIVIIFRPKHTERHISVFSKTNTNKKTTKRKMKKKTQWFFDNFTRTPHNHENTHRDRQAQLTIHTSMFIYI